MLKLVSKPSRASPNRCDRDPSTRNRRLSLPIAIFILAAQFLTTVVAAEDHSLILATTTSVRDSGLLEMLLPDFEEKTGIEVRVIAVGTGAALRMGRQGDVDLLLTHAPPAEAELVKDGFVTRRTPFMENFFVIAGPAEDPARVAEASSPADAIRRIAMTESRWVSRGDDSGTHKKEKSLFKAAGLEGRQDWEGLDRTGSGMGLSLQVAGEYRAYILSDLGTFLAFRKRIDLVALSQPADSLRNTYSILQLDATRFDRPLATSNAGRFEDYLLDSATQARIGLYGIKRFGRPLFTPLHLTQASDAASNPHSSSAAPSPGTPMPHPSSSR